MDKFYKTILTISFHHEYYGDSGYSSATLLPSQDTTVFMKNHRILLKQNKGKYVLLQEAAVDSGIPTIEFDQAKLSFGIAFNDVNFQLRSGMNYDLRSEKIIISNDKGGEVIISEKDILPLWNSLPQEITTSDFNVLNKHDESVFTSEMDPRMFNVLEPDIYKVNGTNFFKIGGAIHSDALFIVSLKGNEEQKEVSIKMPSGSYKWRYHVLKKYSKAKSVTLVDENEEIQFEVIPSETDDRLVFLSKSPIKLLQIKRAALTIYDNETVIKKFLPLPELENARFMSAEDKSLVLESYVTI
jgi:hypothetical protein